MSVFAGNLFGGGDHPKGIEATYWAAVDRYNKKELTAEQKLYVDELSKPKQKPMVSECGNCCYQYLDQRGMRHKYLERTADQVTLECEDGSRSTMAYHVFMGNYEVAA